MQPLRQLLLTPELVRLIGEIDEFKGCWQALGQALGKLAPERLSALRRVATIESIGSSTRGRFPSKPFHSRVLAAALAAAVPATCAGRAPVSDPPACPEPSSAIV